MFEISPSIRIDAPPMTVWEYLIDVEGWWVASSPEHDDLELLSDDDVLREGSRLRIEEEVAGLPGQGVGTITEYATGERVTWEAPEFRYTLYGLPITVSEGVRWTTEPADDGTELTANVWARFPDSLYGRVVEWIAINVLDAVEKDRRHAMTELEYVKAQLENDTGS